MEAMLVEGLQFKRLDDIVALIVKLRFNCVRLTYPIYMFTRYANLTVQQSFQKLDLKEAITGITQNNPSILNMTIVEAYVAVVDSLIAHGIMVVSDNHVSQPGWCCGNDDGNGFFGDRYFDPQEWLQGLRLAAETLKNKSHVVAMSLRNELRGGHQKEDVWYQYMSEGAKLIHQINPNVLVVVSGLSYDTDLGFLKNRPMGFNLDNKLVFEIHLYSFSHNGRGWMSNPLNTFCASSNQGFEDRAGFLVRGQNSTPLFVSEFGIDQTGADESQNRFLNCFSTYLTENDFDWALWALQGSYYRRDGMINSQETYGVLDSNFTSAKKSNFLQKFELLQTKLQDPSSKQTTSFIMYYPLTGECVLTNEKNQLALGGCSRSYRWSHEKDGAPMRSIGSKLCLKAVGDGQPPILNEDCSSQQSAWKYATDAKLQLASTNKQGQALCLQSDPTSGLIVTKSCMCLNDAECREDPQSQWFKLVPSNAYSSSLSTNGRWIVEATTGQRVKLMCVNWPGHMQAMLIEGLHLRPLDNITASVAKLHFNCVRLTYSIHMFTRHANLTVQQSFENFDLNEAIAINNPSILNLTLVEA
ncbi:uncharacterized protein LOC111468874 [Cucurbita maxima]|uniref:Uncharacterized protein LOC111468874 n=1 Tax=Cucurbita maxima TaxID=3661 RepID=A0A6J1I1Y1_CUCMA|nr:uncharacterized protein LOC111468874 [Cucurbita maxima]